jgi:carbonic anhydrase
MSVTDDLLRNAEQYATGFDKGSLPSPPAKGVAIVACMDARLLPSKLFGLEEGDAHVIRNAGGVITDDEIRSLAISQHLLGTTAVILVHHTKCGMQTFTDEQFADQLESFAGRRPDWSANTFSDLDDDVRESIRRITSSPFIKAKDDVRGFVYEVETGHLREVTEGQPARS